MMRLLGLLLLSSLAVTSARKLNDEDLKLEGERCGDNNPCIEGLECAQTGVFKRCIPQTSCLSQELRKFQEEFNSQDFKMQILREANVREEDIFQASVASQNDETIFKNGSVRSLIRAMQHHVGTFSRFGSIVSRCSAESSEEPVGRQGPPTGPPIGTPPVGAPIGPPNPQPTFPRSMAPSSRPSSIPSESPTFIPPQTIFAGFHVEAGALVEGSITLFWDMFDPSGTPPVFAKGCMGVGPVVGAELSLVTIVAETTEANDITCLSSMYGVDVGVGLALGYGLGVCLLTEPPFVYNEFTFGSGIGLGASAFSMCNGVSTGIDLGIFGGGIPTSESNIDGGDGGN